ncbi:MAG: AraC family transcriptional regulator [Pseudomonadota bacterium]
MAHKTDSASHLQFDAAQLKPAVQSPDRFRTIKLENDTGKLLFRVGTVSLDVSFTHSQCILQREYLADIAYHEDTTLLIFGLEGYSDFKPQSAIASYRVRAGDVWYMRLEGGVMQRNTPANQTSQMVVVKYTGSRLDDALGGAPSLFGLGTVTAHRLGQQIDHDVGLEKLINNPLSSAPERLLAEATALQLLARWIAPSREVIQSLLEPAENKLSAKDQLLLSQVVSKMVSDPTQVPSLRELAEGANMSHARLNRCFKQVYGTTVFEWLRRYRLALAHHHLADPTLSITDIALRFGFTSASHFSATFKKTHGCSPGEYRRPTRNH